MADNGFKTTMKFTMTLIIQWSRLTLLILPFSLWSANWVCVCVCVRVCVCVFLLFGDPKPTLDRAGAVPKLIGLWASSHRLKVEWQGY